MILMRFNCYSVNVLVIAPLLMLFQVINHLHILSGYCIYSKYISITFVYFLLMMLSPCPNFKTLLLDCYLNSRLLHALFLAYDDA